MGISFATLELGETSEAFVKRRIRMRRVDMMAACDREVQGLLVECSRPVQKALATFVVGGVLAVGVGLSAAMAAAPGRAQDRSKQRRVQRLLTNDGLAVARAQRRLIARATRAGGRIDLVLDATTTGVTAAFPGIVSLVLAMGWHGRAAPLCWRSWRADEPDQAWMSATRAMFARVAETLPADARVVVLADRGLSGANLARAAAAQGWHLLVRVQGQTRVRLADGRVAHLGELTPRPGTAAKLTGVRVFAPRTKQTVWISCWEEAFTANVVAVWPRGVAQPWLLVTDLPPTRARCREDRHRTWEEALFRDLKSFGWGWNRSRVRDPRRVERLVLAFAIATLWLLAVAQRVVKRGWRRLVDDASRRTLSYFQIGRRWVQRCLANDDPVPIHLAFWREIRPVPKTVMN